MADIPRSQILTRRVINAETSAEFTAPAQVPSVIKFEVDALQADLDDPGVRFRFQCDVWDGTEWRLWHYFVFQGGPNQGKLGGPTTRPGGFTSPKRCAGKRVRITLTPILGAPRLGLIVEASDALRSQIG